MVSVFLIYLGLLNCVLFPCQGIIYLPSSGDKMTLLPGSTGRIKWTFDNMITAGDFRSWSFTSTDGTFTEKSIARINGHSNATIRVSFPVIAVEKPATLVLKNVNRSYDGTYKFQILASTDSSSEVVVFIAEKPNATVNCSNLVTRKEGENFACVCKSEGGNPPANVTWFKDGVKITDVGTKEQTLNLLNIGGADKGIYKCVATSYPHENYTDEKSVQVIVRYSPTNTVITFSPDPAVFNQSLNITCASDGFPEPNFIIYHNGTKEKNGNRLVIENVKWNHTGTYKCIANNSLGNDSRSDFLNVIEAATSPSSSMISSSSTFMKFSIPMTSATITISATIKTSAIEPSRTMSSSDISTALYSVTDNDPKGTSEDNELGTGEIVGIVVGVVAFLVLICGLIIYCKSKERENQSDVNPNGSKVITNNYELEEDQLEGGGNTYDTAKPPDKGEGSQNNAEQKPPGDSLPPVYASVNKDNRQGNTLYASLDSEALKRPSQKKPAENQPKIAPTEYASIDFMKTAKTPNDDSVST